MKDLSFFLLKNLFGSKMKNFKNFCSGESSTSILDQRKADLRGGAPLVASPPIGESPPTLEEMILQLEMEEKMTRRSRGVEHRMSCVNSSDILRGARNALNQYPRFSLDGKDAMYRSSFAEVGPIKPIKNHDFGGERKRRLPSVVGGESVMWCKPGVVGKLMGLDAMPIPLNSNYRRERLNAIIKSQNLRRRAEKHELERRRVGRGVVGSCSRTGYCVINPVELDIPRGEAGWPIRRFL